MKRYWDLVRNLLIAIEDNHRPHGNSRTEEAVEEHLHDLIDMGWIRLHPSLRIEDGRFMLNGEPVQSYYQLQTLRQDLFQAMSLRPAGKDFLDMVRHEEVWQQVMNEVQRCNGLPTEMVVDAAKRSYFDYRNNLDSAEFATLSATLESQ